MKLEETTVDNAGMFRCCTSGLDKIPLDAPVFDGMFVPCKYCTSDGSGVMLRGNVWVAKWVHDKDETSEPTP